jgi:hypothetical protein
MALIVLSTLGLVGCAFLIFVLAQWLRETNRKPTRRSPIISGTNDSNETKRAIIIRFPRAAAKYDQPIPAPGRLGLVSGQKNESGSTRSAAERWVYHRIAKSLGSRKRA